MNNHRLFNWALAFAIAATLSTSYMLDGPDDIRAAQDTAHSLSDAQASEQRALRFAKKAAGVCGPNAGADDLGNGKVQCYTHNGRKTFKAEL